MTDPVFEPGDTILTNGKQGVILQTYDNLVVQFDEGILSVSRDAAEIVKKGNEPPVAVTPTTVV